MFKTISQVVVHITAAPSAKIRRLFLRAKINTTNIHNVKTNLRWIRVFQFGNVCIRAGCRVTVSPLETMF